MNQSTRKIVAGLLSIAMVLTFAANFTASPAVADAAMYSRNLTVGSRGTDVTDLQTMLNAGGFLKVSPTGYFGSLTRAALGAWQASVGISPAAGYFGPITRAYVANMGTVVGNNGCPAGAMYNPQTGAKCTTTTTGGGTTSATCDTPSDGSLTLSYVSYAPSSQTLKKGDMNKNLISVKLQAVNGKVNVSRFDVHFSERPWLDFGSLTLVTSSGQVLATKSLSGPSDVTEVTVGTDYLVRFDNVSGLSVAPGSDVIVAVQGNVLAASDKITGQVVYVGVPSGSIRTVNCKGYTDSLGLTSGQGSGVTSTTGNAVTLASTGSTATVFTRISPSTPAQRIQVTSNTQNTNDVVLGVFGIKVQNQNATINSLSFNINTGTSTASYATTSLISNLRLKVGGQTYGANSLAAGNTTFTNMNVPLTADQWTDVTLVADINSGFQSNNITASSTLVAASIGGVDANYNTVTLTNAANVTSNSITFLQSGLTLSSASAALGQAITGVVPGNVSGTIGNQVSYAFTLTNAGNTDVYVSNNPGAMLGTSSALTANAAVNASSTIDTVVVGDSGLAADTSSAYVIPAGNSRTFTFAGKMKGAGGGGVTLLKITAIYFNSTAANVTATSSAGTQSINFGLNQLYLSATYP